MNSLFISDLVENGLNAIPVTDKKRPWYKWAYLQKELISTDDLQKLLPEAWGVCLVCGQVSGNLEAIDFDSHYIDITDTWLAFITDPGIKDIVERNNLYTETTINKGFHLIYRYEAETAEGNQVLAANDQDKTLIETRGEGGIIVINPSPGYTHISGDLIKMNTITAEEREYLLSTARGYNQSKKIEEAKQTETKFDNTDPVSWFNYNKAGYAKNLLKDIGWTHINTHESIEHWERPGKNDKSTSATWGKKDNQFYLFTTDGAPFETGCFYSPFQILVKLKFKGNYISAINWIIAKYFSEEVPYIRVSTDYYKIIHKSDRYDIQGIELKPWKKDEIKQDHGGQYLYKIPLFDDFCIVPDNFNHHPVVNNCYNLYFEFRHKPAAGKCIWSNRLMEHVFGEQLEIGIRYMQLLYLHPDRIAPILVLVSRERQTGKTTFLNWLNMIFGFNMVVISPDDLVNGFNAHYATSNIIAVEETLVEKAMTVEKIKALATGKFITVNRKFVNQFKLPFFGKIIMTSNNEDKFARIDQEEVRFFIRKLGTPKFENHNIEYDLIQEIPAFLHQLTQLQKIDFTKSRTGFTAEELKNDNLNKVMEESRSGLYKDLYILFSEYFANLSMKVAEIQCTPVDIKNKWFNNNSRIDLHYIKHVLKNEFRMEPAEDVIRYIPFSDESNLSKPGRPYTFNRSIFKVTGDDFEIPF